MKILEIIPDCRNATYNDLKVLIDLHMVFITITNDNTKLFKNIRPVKVKSILLASAHKSWKIIDKIVLDDGKKYNFDFNMEFFESSQKAIEYYNSEIIKYQKVIKEKIQYSIDLYNDMEGFKINLRQKKLERILK